ncbi:hypothetical protein AAHC03_04923 [Spirometra sp. Aus1]
MPFYAVGAGRKTGVFSTWAECQKQIAGFSGAIYKKFNTESDAKKFLVFPPTAAVLRSDLLKIPKMVLRPMGIGLVRGSGSTVFGKVQDVLPVPFMHDLHDPCKVLVYTDGSCKDQHMAEGKKKRRAGIGVFWGVDHPWNLSARLIGKQTNNRAELEACTQALKKANLHGLRDIKIVTDSKFTINCASEWCFKWQKNDWKLSTGKPVVVRDAVERLLQQLSVPGLRVSWCHSPGHKGVWGNEEADRLANEGADLPYPEPLDQCGDFDDDCDDEIEPSNCDDFL